MPPDAGKLESHWLAETIRLREEHWGPLEDAQETRIARTGAQALPDRILLRARLLARRTGLAETAARWRQGARFTLIVAAALALLAGTAAAMAALGDGQRPVNVLWAAGGLLGLHLLTFLLWLASLGLRASQGAGLGRFWLWATRKLARGPDAALAPQALTGLLARQGALRWMLGAVSNGLWLLALAATLATLLAALSTRRYGFAWETTILQPDTFVALVQALGWLPGQLGFPVPDAATIRASDGLQVQPAAARALWSGWLLGVLAVYGILPRLLALLACAALAWRACRRLAIDPGLPGYAALRARLAPPAEHLAPDAPEPERAAPHLRAAPVRVTADAVLTAIELPADLAWPPAAVPAGVQRTPVLDSREQRHALLDALRLRTPARLLIACDARQTPDRGTLALIVDLAALAGAARVWLLAAGDSPRTALWIDRLRATGLADADMGSDGATLLRWLETGHD